MAQKSYKIYFGFDEGLRELETFYTLFTKKEPTSSYYDIKKIFKSLGFEWDQYSGYVSKDNIDIIQAYKIVNTLDEKLPWFKYCNLHFRVTEVSETVFSFDEFFADSIEKNKENDARLYNIDNIDELLKSCRNYQKYYPVQEKDSSKNNEKHEQSDIEWAKETLKKYEKESEKHTNDEPNQKSSRVENEHDGRD